jgi:hypothetical protein
VDAVTEWVEDGWLTAVSRARQGWNASPLERVHGIALVRAGKGPIARFRPGELSRLTRIPESDLHDVVEAGIGIFAFGAESHPQAILILDNWPSYAEPSREPTDLAGTGMRAVKRTRRGVTSWRLEAAK